MFDPISADLLSRVHGGMRLDPDLRDPIDDRRHLTRWQSMHVHRPLPAPLPRVARHPGDLPSQAGLDDIGHVHARRVSRRRRFG